MGKESKIGYVCDDFTTIKLKSVLLKNDAGDWGSNPDENAIGIIRSTNFNNNGILDLTDVAYRTLSPKKKEEKKLYVGDILIERSGGSDTQPVGRVGLITEHMLNEDFAFANFIQRISVKKDILLPQYLYYCLQQMYEMGITASMQAQTTGIRNLDWKQYVKTILPKPSLSEQTAIAKILSTVDEAIRSTRETISKLERVKKSLMQNLLSGKMKPDGTLRSADEFYEDEKMGLVPKGWTVKAIGDKSICKINPNYSYVKNKEYDFIPMEAIKDKFRGVDYMEKQKIGTGSFTRFKKGDILFAKITPCSENGKVALVEEMTTDVGFASTEFIVFQPQNNIDNKYCYYLLSSGAIHRLAISLMEGTTGRQRIPWKIFRNRIFVPIPEDIEEQKMMVRNISSIEDLCKTKQEKITALELLKKSLMQQLLTGRVRVK